MEQQNILMYTQARKKILFLVPYPFDEAPSQRFRFEQYFDILDANGIDYRISSFLSIKAWHTLYTSGNYLYKIGCVIAGFVRRLFDMIYAINVNLVFIHREAAPVGPPFFEWILYKLLKKKIIYDFDDAIWISNTSAQNKIASKLKCHWKVKYICQYAYKISVGNEFLASYVRRFNINVLINPTTIKYTIPRNTTDKVNSTITIGWTGTHSTMKYLDLIRIPIMQLYKEFDICFTIISNQKPSDFFVPFTYIKWDKKSELQDLSRFDIGIMPLADDEWSKGKCGFKALQYMALGIPVVASKVGANIAIIDSNINGYLAENQIDWYNQLKLLIEDIDLRNTVGLLGNLKVKNNYSTKANNINFLSILS